MFLQQRPRLSAMTVVPTVPASQVEATIARAARRVADLLRSARHPTAVALGEWDVSQVAAHLSHALDGITAMAEGGGGILGDIWDLRSLTGRLVEGETEADLLVLADRIEATTARFLAVLETADWNSRTWLVRSIEVAPSRMACHFLNELVMHGWDVAVAEGARWPIPREDASLILCGFLLPTLGELGRAMVDQEAAAGLRATYDLRVRGGCRFALHFEDGGLTVTPGPPPAGTDCHLSVEPAAFLLVAWGRVSQWRPILRGQLLAWGRRPWLGLALRKVLRNP
jgi:uncharacterized protein (TIGR03083 family)